MNGRFSLYFFLLFSVVLLGCSAGESETASSTGSEQVVSAPTPTPDWVREGWELVWQDEFDGSEINLDNWTHEVGGHGWGNGESQFYTDDPKNAFIEDGQLVIQALEENFRGKLFTSARLSSQDKVEVEYGRIEARIQIPVGTGLWPAFWMLGDNFNEAGWPFSGEIDIMENIGSEPSHIHGTVHGPGYFGADGVGASKRLFGGARYTDNFYVYAIEWEEKEIRWYVDDQMYHKLTPNAVPGEWVYDHPFFLILNVAVGGAWPGYPDQATTFPQTMRVDYVRIYQPDSN